jgi:ubiquinone/menaquinone biosynthesis C-methylase UbiE
MKLMLDILDKYETQNLAQGGSESDPFTLERYEQFYAYMPKGAIDILDIGANTGRGGVVLKNLNNSFRITALDCVKSRLNAIPDCYHTTIYGLSNDIPAEDRTFDAIVAGEFLEHLYPSDVDTTLCEFQRVLKIGGRVLLTTPNPYYLRNILTGATIYGTSHLTQHWPKVLKLRLQMHGFSNVRVRGSGKMTRYIGYHVPFLALYGSYLITGDKI